MNFQKVPLAPGLIFVGVPIGTARDITLRALDVLASADRLAAEDTRSLRKLMEIHGVPLDGRRIETFHDHSKQGVIARLVDHVAAGEAVAYASEAGMPLIADPGFELVRAMQDAGHAVTVAPGPSALPSALAVAGLPTDRFLFGGFLPQTKAARQKALADLRDVQATLVFFESPNRLAAMLADAATTLGSDRQAAVCRELTKKFEETRRGTLGDLAEGFDQHKVKGEIVVLIDRAGLPAVNDDDLETALMDALSTMTTKDAAHSVADLYGIPKRKAYQMALALSTKASEG